MYGGAGGDYVIGGQDDDSIDGGTGDDQLYGDGSDQYGGLPDGDLDHAGNDVIAGDALSPSNNQPVADAITAWVNGLSR